MSNNAQIGGAPSVGRFYAAVACLLIAGLFGATVPGCGGCGCRKAKKTAAQLKREKEEEERRKKAEEERKRPDFEVGSLLPRPQGGLPTDEQLRIGTPYKPGHWTPTTLAAKTNHYDFVGDLELVVTDRGSKPLPLVGMPYQLSTSRPLALPKRQPKAFGSVLYVPPNDRQAFVSCRLYWRRGRRRAWEVQQPLRRMPSYQYHFVVLAREPERYTYLTSLPTVRPPSDEFNNPLRTAPYYWLAFLSTARRPALPTHALLWTSIAAVLWDDAQAASLDRDQQQALVDWLHWGGHLVVSGPESLDGLTDSFLNPYLPATADGGRGLDRDDFRLLADWSSANKGRPTPPLEPLEPLSGVRLKLRPGARFLGGAGDLLAERRVGRGRVVVSAFPLSGRAMTSWPGWDEMVNAFLLRRPARMYVRHVEKDPGTNQPIEVANPKEQLEWADGTERLDADRITGLRYFTRDTGVPRTRYGADVASGPTAGFGLGDSPPGPGRAAWNDFNPVGEAARNALREAARIEIPNRDFVVWVIGGYLAVLVPLNWVVFRLLGRVEWAWAAAPVIAVISTAVVVHLARLDIGFARSRTEVAVLELQGDCPRAHLTRYCALYTSLSESYDFCFDDGGALIQPLPEPTVIRPGDFRLKFGESYRRLRCERGERVRLEGFAVPSNSRRFVHCEEMIDLDGGLIVRGDRATGFELTNRTGLELQAAGVLWRGGDGSLYSAWLADVAADPGRRVPLRFEPLGAAEVPGPRWAAQRGDSVLAPTAGQGELNLAALAVAAERVASRDPKGERGAVAQMEPPILPLEPGDMRLTAAVTGPLGGMVIDPDPRRQTRQATLVVAHLRYGFGPDPRPDVNTRKTPKVMARTGQSQWGPW